MERISPTLRPTLSAGPIDIDSVYTCDENTHVEIVTAVYDFAGVESGDLSFVVLMMSVQCRITCIRLEKPYKY